MSSMHGRGSSPKSDDDKFMHEVRTKILPRRGIEAREDEVLITEGWKQGWISSCNCLSMRSDRLPSKNQVYLKCANCCVCIAPASSFSRWIKKAVVDERLDRCELVVVTPRRHAPTGRSRWRARQKQLLRPDGGSGRFDCRNRFVERWGER